MRRPAWWALAAAGLAFAGDAAWTSPHEALRYAAGVATGILLGLAIARCRG